MLISEFARATGLTRDTVRFYVRRGLLTPATNAKGGRHPYQSFTAADVQAAKIIRSAQSLGMSLKEIAAISEERRAGRMTRQRSIEIVTGQLGRLEAKTAELDAMRAYLRAKIDWLAGGEQGKQPDFEICTLAASPDRRA
jgi:DNA-binding transcriptional MerR regulator